MAQPELDFVYLYALVKPVPGRRMPERVNADRLLDIGTSRRRLDPAPGRYPFHFDQDARRGFLTGVPERHYELGV